METETEQIFKEQLKKLPKEVVNFLSSANWSNDLDEIGSTYNLTEKELSDFKREVAFVLAGLVHPDEFRETLEKEAGIEGTVLETIVANTENKIFAPIRPLLIDFFEGEASESESQSSKVEREEPDVTTPVIARNEAIQDLNTGDSVQDVNLLIQPRRSTDSQRQADSPVPPSPPSMVNGQMSNVLRMPDIAPENLPTEEGGESFLPPIPLKFGVEGRGAPTHPFEEKMKKVFTAGQQSLGDFAIEPPSQAPSPKETPKAPPIYHADPYREPIE